jgi:pimeloyl-ACP methyl ester carboxylesterase
MAALEPLPTTVPPSATTVPRPARLPAFEEAPCSFGDLTGFSTHGRYDLRCGHLVVLEDRADPDGSLVRLPVAIAETTNPDPEPEPVVYLAGGGGHAHLNYATFYLASVGEVIVENRDFIQYNQRGAPDTEPALDCPGYTEFLFDLAGEAERDSLWTKRHADFLDGCRAALVERGVDLSQYNSATNAADATDLLTALGYDQANFYGTSYGTRLGLDLIRDYPDRVRSIILDSVYPPEAGYYSEYARNLYRAMSEVFDGCAADADCNHRFPDLEATFLSTVDSLNAEPVILESPFGLVSVDGGVFMDAVLIYLYAAESIRFAPTVIDRTATGDYRRLEQVIGGAVTIPDLSWVMFYSMQCREEVPFESEQRFGEMSEGLPEPIVEHIGAFSGFHFGLCESWTSGIADPVENERVVSEVPALVLAGGYDPATPPEWSRSAAAGLTNGYYYEFPGQGHGIMRANECGLSIGLSFLDDPTRPPDAGCLADESTPDFVIPR